METLERSDYIFRRSMGNVLAAFFMIATVTVSLIFLAVFFSFVFL